MVPGLGFEPRSTAPKAVVLPLDDPGIYAFYYKATSAISQTRIQSSDKAKLGVDRAEDWRYPAVKYNVLADRYNGGRIPSSVLCQAYGSAYCEDM